MSALAEEPSASRRAHGSVDLFRAVRILAWAALLGMTGLLVRAEVRRPSVPDGVELYAGLTYRLEDGRRAKLDLYVPRAPAPPGGRPAIVAIHGGGWRGGSRREYGPSVAPLAQRGYVVAVVDYALSRPGRPSWPKNLEDVREAVRWLRAHAGEYRIDQNRIAAIGASAGGHLAALLGTWPEGVPEGSAVRDRPSARVNAVVSFYGPMDLSALQGASRNPGGPIDLLLGGLPENVPERAREASPRQHVTRDDPPMLLIHGDKDYLIPANQSDQMAATLRDSGIRHQAIHLPLEGHGFGLVARGHDLAQEILAFLDEAWNDDSERSHLSGRRVPDPK